MTYRDEVKAEWVGVSAELIEEKTAVCQEVAQQMAVGVLNRTLSASFSVAITGHLGPNAPLGLDGVAYVGFAARGDKYEVPRVETLNLQSLHRLESRSRQPEKCCGWPLNG